MGFFACGLGTSPKDIRPVIEWEEPRCLLCNSHKGSILLEAPDPVGAGQGLWFAVTQCQDCGLCFTSPRPAPNSIHQFYASPARRARIVCHGTSLCRRPRWLPRTWQSFNRFENLPVCGQRRLLDFGRGSASFARRMHEHGWKVTRLDPFNKTSQLGGLEPGITMLAGDLPHPELGEQSFDVITMRHALEHLHQPLQALRAANQLLVGGGTMIVTVPNIDSLPFKWFGRYWWGLNLPRHLTHFTPDTLHLMLTRAGFEVGHMRMLRQAGGLERSARLAQRHGHDAGWRTWLRARPLATLATWYASCARRSDAMQITATKRGPGQTLPTPLFSRHDPDQPYLPGDRWRNR
jgi:SAM-dependent methyltransferase